MSEEEIIEALNEIAARFREQHLCGYEHVVNAVALIVQQQAQIARVRGICEVIVENAHQFYEVWDEYPTAAQVPYGQWMVARHILRALEGGSDE